MVKSGTLKERVINYLKSQRYIVTRRAPTNGEDLYFSINGKSFGILSIYGDSVDKPLTIEIPLHTSFSNLKEDKQLIKQLTEIYDIDFVESNLTNGYQRISLKKEIHTLSDANKIYSLGAKIKEVRASSEENQTRLTEGLEKLLLKS